MSHDTPSDGERTSDIGTDGGVAPAVDAADDGPRPVTYYHLARAVLYREFLIFVRYPANALGGIVVALFFSGRCFTVGDS